MRTGACRSAASRAGCPRSRFPDRTTTTSRSFRRRLRGAPDRDDPRRPGHADGRAAAPRSRAPLVDGRFARPLGGRYAGDRHDQFHRPDQLPRRRRELAPGGAPHAAGPRHHRYRFTVEDPTTWTRPWTVTYPIIRTEGPIYEFACHEGNYGLRDILSGARYEEKIADEIARKK